nr:glycoside hydrolase family 3 N-terminal domain-containing protein [Bacillus sp. JCM 19034]
MSLPTINKTISELEAFEFVPFQEAIKHGLESIMTAHIVYPQVDPNQPATLSKVFLTEILRKQLGYEGLIITDSMEMEAISHFYGREKGTVLALQAGADLILACGEEEETQFQMIDAAVNAVEQGELDPTIIETAFKRSLKYKDKWVEPDYSSTKEEILAHCNNHSTQSILEKIACEGITVVQDNRKLLPLSFDRSTVIYQKTLNDENYIGYRKNPCPAIFTEAHYQLIALENSEPTLNDIAAIYNELSENELVILFINERRHLKTEWASLIENINNKTNEMIVVSLWNPQIINDIPYKDVTYIASFSNTSHVIQAVKMVIEGKVLPKGNTPVTILNRKRQNYDS